MRLLYVSQSFPPTDRPLDNVGGMQRVAVELHQALGQRPDIELDAIVLRSSRRWHRFAGIAWLIATYWRIRHKALRGEIDAVLFSSLMPATLATVLRPTLASLGIPMAAIAHGRDVTQPGPYQLLLVRRILDSLDAIFSVSRATAAECMKRGCAKEKIRVIPNGVDPSRLAAAADRGMHRRRLAALDGGAALPDDAFVLCSVGRQVPRKGFAWFVENVMPLLPGDVHYWLAGDGPEAPAIAEAAAQRGLTHRVRLLGRIPDEDLATLYHGADLFVMPNVPVRDDIEGFGVVMLEAGVCGRPAIASRLEGIQDVIADGKNGDLVTNGDADAFTEAILDRYRNRAALAESAQHIARYAGETFGWASIAGLYVQAMRGLLPDLEAKPAYAQESYV